MNEIHKRYVASVMPPVTNGSYQGWSLCISWCEENIVEGWWYIGEGVFEFLLDTDYLMFMLKYEQ
jgi:hypothetical protein